jgi:glycosyltransferase involved in cell wall biosynthesis
VTKLVIQIPCFNEEATLGTTLAQLPRAIPGVDVVERLIVDDGSVDRTVEVAREHGVEHVVALPRHRGLARAFVAGLQASLAAGADIIVTTDADNQYHAGDIEKLVRPVLERRADMVIGARPIGRIEHFSRSKKLLQRLGSWVVRVVSGADVEDAPSGFRAIGSHAARRLNVFNDYTYTLETIIQAGRKNMAVMSVPVRVNPDLRPSRLISSPLGYVWRSMLIIGRIFVIYRPLRSFFLLGAIPFVLGLLLVLRWLILYLFFLEPGRSWLPSLVVAGVLVLAGIQVFILGLMADLVAVNRHLLEEMRFPDELSERPDGNAAAGSADGDRRER